MQSSFHATLSLSFHHGALSGLHDKDNDPSRSQFFGALELVKRHVVFKTARMYKGVTPELPVERIFGITTFELG
ncbi:MAG: hypothetical protein MI702_07235 [Chlorobiales bacterium]|nr:hypothetical protein [Chlorobiales bacterium]